MEKPEPNFEAQLQDMANKAGIPVEEMRARIAEAEKNARARLQADRSSGGLRWFGLPSAAYRDGRHPRPAATYRGARRNAARAAHWPGR
jgi:hypothetical protein